MNHETTETKTGPQHGSKSSSPLGLLDGVLPRRRASVLPGFRLTLGFTLVYTLLVVLVPLSTLFWKSASLGAAGFWAAVTAPRVVASYELTFGASLAAAL